MLFFSDVVLVLVLSLRLVPLPLFSYFHVSCLAFAILGIFYC